MCRRFRLIRPLGPTCFNLFCVRIGSGPVVVVPPPLLLGGWVRAVENHGVRPMPFRVRSKYSPEEERYQREARFVSLYYDAPVATKKDLEVKLRLEEPVLRFNTMRLPSILDEVHALGWSALWITAPRNK